MYNILKMNTIPIALSGLNAASNRLYASASNIANLHTTGSIEGAKNAPYTPIEATQSANTQDQGGGASSKLTPTQTPITTLYAPDSPFANTDGLIGAPNIDLAAEAVNIKLAELSYRANINIIKAADENMESLLDIFDNED